MDLGDYVSVVTKRWLSIAVLTSLGIAAGLYVSLSTTPLYRASTTVFFSLTRGSTVTELVQGNAYTENLVLSYAQVVQMPVVLDPVINELGLSTNATALSKTVTAEAPVDTVLLQIYVTNPSPRRAAEIANAIGGQLARSVAQLTPGGADGQAVKVTTVAAAQPPGFAVSPRKKLDVGAGALIGLMCGLGLAVVRRLLDNKVSDQFAVEAITDAPLVAAIPRSQLSGPGGTLADLPPHDPQTEAFRRARTNLVSLNVDRRPMALVVTSATSGEGKTTLSLNLARTFAASDLRVLLVDADLRSPSVAAYTSLEGSAGLTTALTHHVPLEDLVQPWGNSNLHVLTSGAPVLKPSELLGSRAMATLITTMLERYDLVLLDGAPLLPVTDSAVLCGLTSGAVVVVDGSRTRKHQFRDAISMLDAAGVLVHGILLNKVPLDRGNTYYGAPSTGRGMRQLARLGRRHRASAASAPVSQSYPQPTQELTRR